MRSTRACTAHTRARLHTNSSTHNTVCIQYYIYTVYIIHNITSSYSSSTVCTLNQRKGARAAAAAERFHKIKRQATMIKEVIDKQVVELKKLWDNKRQLLFQCLNLAMIVFSALMIWKALMFMTKVGNSNIGGYAAHIPFAPSPDCC